MARTPDLDVPKDDERWRAVCERDPAADGAFVYGVRTTGVYCRPSCPSRRAHRENVAFYATSEAARTAGLRACRRCRPDRPEPRAATTAAMVTLARHIEAHADDRLPLAELAARVGLSSYHVQRTFKAVFGVTPKQFHQTARRERFKLRLREGADVLDAAFGAGFRSTSRVYDGVDRHLGVTPGRYRQGGAGEVIHAVLRQTAVGLLLLAATDRGVCFAQFGASEAALRAELAREFPAADVRDATDADPVALDDWMRALEAHLAGGAPRPDLPLDLRGTAFQIRVWTFLTGTRDGDVLTYKALADGIGAPTAIRAAASACAANRIAVLVPCHRVLRGDGGLGGYRWGEDRKRALLAAEAARR